MKNSLAINTSMLDGYDSDIWMRFTKELDVPYVEFAFNQGYAGQFDASFFCEARAKLLSAQLREYDLKTVAMGCTMDMGDADAAPAFIDRIIFAAQLGVVYLNTNATSIAKKEQFFKNLDQILPAAEKYGCVVCLENGGDQKYDLFGCARDGIEIVEKYKSEQLAINYDAGNLVSLRPHLSPTEDALEALPYCRHIHLKDVKVHDDRYTFPSIGEGIINYRKILSAVVSCERSIPLSIEKPLRVHRRKDASAVRSDERVDLYQIKSIVETSVKFVKACLV